MAAGKRSKKKHNKKLARRREGLSTKAYDYGDLDGVELAIFIRYPKPGYLYSYLSAQDLLCIQVFEKIVTKNQQLDVGFNSNQRTCRRREAESRADQTEAKEAKIMCNARRRQGRR